MANTISYIRIILSAALLFFPVFSPAFYVIYISGGLTDILDGIVARKTNTVSSFGEKLDTTADFVFVTVCLIKFIPAVQIPVWLYVWIAIIALIKLISIVSGYIMHNKLVTVHSFMNKFTGVFLFILPLTFWIIDLKYSGIAACAIATFAALQEGHIIGSEFRLQQKTY